MKTYSVIIPCYNEALNIRLILEKFNAVIDRNDIEIVLVDNGPLVYYTCFCGNILS